MDKWKRYTTRTKIFVTAEPNVFEDQSYPLLCDVFSFIKLSILGINSRKFVCPKFKKKNSSHYKEESLIFN